ncbi:MAG TPA: hypothetical protein VM432_10290 [Bdellovibrionales bacterium]|nr:hypothetical protein [Bdellovibrionales bacterium]
MSSHGLRVSTGGLVKVALQSVLFAAFLVIFAGCQAPGPIQDVQLRYSNLKRTLIDAFPTGVREQSPNGRTLIFNYFDPMNWSKRADTDPVRVYAVVVINGSSRPYNLDAQIIREKKGPNGQYQSLGRDPELSEKLIKELKGLLANRREDK